MELEGTPSKVDNVKNPTSQAQQGKDTLTATREGKKPYRWEWKMTMDAKMKEATMELTATNWSMKLQPPKEDSTSTERRRIEILRRATRWANNPTEINYDRKKVTEVSRGARKSERRAALPQCNEVRKKLLKKDKARFENGH